MAAAPTPDAGGAQPQPGPPQPGPQGGPQPGGPEGAPSQAPSSPEGIMLAKLYQACKALAQQNPVMSAGLSKAAEGIQEAQTALVTAPKNEPMQQTPPY